MNAAITHWDPFRGLTSLQDQVNRLLDGAFVQGRTGQADLAAWAPAVDIYEGQNELVAKVDLPGVEEKDIDIRLENNTLTIRGERKFEKSVNEENYLRVERAYGSFTRTFSLPNMINAQAINASYNNGVLTVHMPKREESKPKQVKINVSGNGK
jgi:HSP20 family protein